MNTPTHQLGDIVYMRYQGDSGPNGNRGKIVCISEVAEGAFHYTVETASRRQHTGLNDDTVSVCSIPVPTIHTAIRVLNEALAADRYAITCLVAHRVPCLSALEAHPTVQVAGEEGAPEVGLLGILNGVLEPMTGRRVMAVYENERPDEIAEFRVWPGPQENQS